MKREMGLMLAAFAFGAAFAAGGKSDMPTLNWIGRRDAVRAAKDAVMKILREDRTLSYRAEADMSHAENAEGAENILVHGDNLEALKALMPFYAGRVKCIYIDPPYNTGSAFEHYDDNVEHSTWLNMMYPRLQLLREFLREDGSIWISIDDREGAYLRVICDEIFGRQNFVSNISWQRTYSTRNDAKGIVNEVEHILVYSKREGWQPKKLARTEEMNKKYKNPDGDRAPWRNSDAFAPSASTHQGMVYAVQNPFNGKLVYPSRNRCWPIEQSQLLEIMNQWCPYELKELDDAKERAAVCGVPEADVRQGVMAIVLSKSLEESHELAEAVYKKGPWPRFFFNSHGNGTIARKTYLENVGGVPPTNLFEYKDVGHTDEAKKEVLKVFDGQSPFATPKPERLIQRVLEIATNAGDLVLDSFLGSGTTAAVAHKMGRRWVGIEMGAHAKTHCAVRLKKVVDGEQGGISKAVKWTGGGGFRFYEQGEPLLDADGGIAESLEFETLAAHIWWQETGTAWGMLSLRGVSESRSPGGNSKNSSNLQNSETPSSENNHKSTVLGIHDGVAYALLYNGVLHDRSYAGGNVLTPKTLRIIQEDLGRCGGGDGAPPSPVGKIVVYAECTRLGEAKLKEAKVEFRQTPYDIVAGR